MMHSSGHIVTGCSKVIVHFSQDSVTHKELFKNKIILCCRGGGLASELYRSVLQISYWNEPSILIHMDPTCYSSLV